MAGVNFEKYKTSQKVKSVMRHCDKDMRVDAQHQNEHIDLSKTKNNSQLNRNYKQTCERFDKRMDWLESQPNKNKRSDKVLCFGLEIPLPEDLPNGKEIEWVNKVKNIVTGMYGSENLMNVYYHVDEQHTYMDSATKSQRLSRKHIHLLVVPEIDGRLNGREFSSRRNMVKLNNQIHEMSLNDYGVKFMDGSKRKSKDSVEALKRSSERLELEAEVKALKDVRDVLKGEIQALEAQRADLIEKPYQDYCMSLKRRKSSGKDIVQTVSDTRENLQRVAEEQKQRHLQERNDRIYDVFDFVHEDYVEAEEQSDEEYT